MNNVLIVVVNSFNCETEENLFEIEIIDLKES